MSDYAVSWSMLERNSRHGIMSTAGRSPRSITAAASAANLTSEKGRNRRHFSEVISERGAAMRETNVTLDPAQTGSESKTLEATLHSLVVGQDEAIEQIVNVYLT